MNDSPAEPDCEFYMEKTVCIPGRAPLGPGRQQPDRLHQLPWCAHPRHSPVPEEVTRTIGAGRRLKCGGTRADGNCPLTEREFEDT